MDDLYLRSDAQGHIKRSAHRGLVDWVASLLGGGQSQDFVRIDTAWLQARPFGMLRIAGQELGSKVQNTLIGSQAGQVAYVLWLETPLVRARQPLILTVLTDWLQYRGTRYERAVRPFDSPLTGHVNAGMPKLSRQPVLLTVRRTLTTRPEWSATEDDSILRLTISPCSEIFLDPSAIM